MTITIHASTIIAALTFVCAPVAYAHDASPGDSHPAVPRYNVTAPLGGGTVKTYVLLSNERTGKDLGRYGRKPEQIGIEIPERVMNSLPATPTALAIDFPLSARSTPFQFMMFDWNPNGHEPDGIYDKPHFDFHFYMQDFEDVMNIKPGSCSGLDCEDYAKAMKPVPSLYLPQGYINVGSVVPFMGNHLIDPASPEFNGKPFTRTWLYGAYDGEVTFYEPMITRASILAQPNQCTALKLAPAYRESGYYPTTYCTEFNERQGVYRVFVTDFVYRQQQ